MPKKCRMAIKGLPGISNMLNTRHARWLATNTKRLDSCLKTYAVIAKKVDGLSLEGARFLEVGAGWVLSHSLAAYVLGAREVYSTDIEKLARPQMLKHAVREAQPHIDWEPLKQLGNVDAMRQRYQTLLDIENYSFSSLEKLGIKYIAPFDLAREQMNIPLDFIFSTSVMEHVPADDIVALLSNLAADLAPGGKMFHYIHLSDHEDGKFPFAFYTETASVYDRTLQSARGNRVRKSQWVEMLSQIEGMDFKFIREALIEDKELPDKIDPSVRYIDEKDLRTIHLDLWGVKK